MNKLKNLRNVKQLIRVCSVSKQGLLVVKGKNDLFHFPNDLTVVPESYAPGLLTAMHLQLNHPSLHQLKQVFNRQFYAIGSDKIVQELSDNCHQCASLKRLRMPETPGSTSAPYSTVGSNFTADVIKRTGQNILVLAEEVTKFTQATLIDSENHQDIYQGLKELILPLHPSCSPVAALKVDPAPAMQTLHRSQALQDISIQIVLGEPKNRNKLATIDKQIQELENEITRLVSPTTRLRKSDLSCAISSLNSRIRSCGLSSYEQWHRRCQFSKNVLNTSDRDLIGRQHDERKKTHSRNPPAVSSTSFQIGSIVYIVDEKTKHCKRPRYIVDNIDGTWLYLRKLTDNQIRTKVYKVHKNRCIKVASTQIPVTSPHLRLSDDDDDDVIIEHDPLCSIPESITVPSGDTRSSLPDSTRSSLPVSHNDDLPPEDDELLNFTSDSIPDPQPALRKSTRFRLPPERLGMQSYNADDSFTEDCSSGNSAEETRSPLSSSTHNHQPSLRKSTRPRKPPEKLSTIQDNE